MLKYSVLKETKEIFQSKQDAYVTLPREFMLEVLNEVLHIRRRNTAHSRRNCGNACSANKNIVKS